MQVFSLAKENKLLRGLLQKQHKNASVVLKDTRSNEKEFLLSGLDSVDSESEGISQVKANEIPSVSFKVGFCFCDPSYLSISMFLQPLPLHIRDLFCDQIVTFEYGNP